VIVLEKDAPRDALIAKILPEVVSINSDQHVLLAGYGMTNPSDDMSSSFNSILRTANALVDIDQFTHAQVPLINLPNEKGSGSCYGDSGGPAFLRERNINYIWGVLSRANCFGRSFYTDLRPHLDWINSVVDHRN
jgi:hypothetical protein